MDEVNALKSQVSLLVKKEDREALLMKFDDLIGKLLLRKQGEYISGIFVREMKENVNELRTEFFKKALTLNEYIEMSLEEVAQRIEIMKNLPKIEKEEQENLLEEIIEYQKRISVDAEYKTIKHINSLKQKLLILERDLAGQYGFLSQSYGRNDNSRHREGSCRSRATYKKYNEPA